MSRPTKLTPELKEKIVEYVRLGNTVATAAKACRIQEETFYRWMRLGRDDDPDYRGFYEAIEQARAEAETCAVQALRMGFTEKDGWRAALEYLKRRNPKEWSSVTSIDIKQHLSLTEDERSDAAGPVKKLSAREEFARLVFRMRELEPAVHAEQTSMVEYEAKLLGEGEKDE